MLANQCERVCRQRNEMMEKGGETGRRRRGRSSSVRTATGEKQRASGREIRAAGAECLCTNLLGFLPTTFLVVRPKVSWVASRKCMAACWPNYRPTDRTGREARYYCADKHLARPFHHPRRRRRRRRVSQPAVCRVFCLQIRATSAAGNGALFGGGADERAR